MKSDSQPEVVELDVEQLETTLDRIEQVMGEEITRPLRLLLTWHLSLVQLIQRKNASIARLRKLLFGNSTERSRDMFGPEQAGSESASGSPADAPADSTSDSATPNDGG